MKDFCFFLLRASEREREREHGERERAPAREHQRRGEHQETAPRASIDSTESIKREEGRVREEGGLGRREGWRSGEGGVGAEGNGHGGRCEFVNWDCQHPFKYSHQSSDQLDQLLVPKGEVCTGAAGTVGLGKTNKRSGSCLNAFRHSLTRSKRVNTFC